MNDCTTCRHYKHLRWLNVHICKHPCSGGTIDEGDVRKINCPGWEPMEAGA